jgi:hypothetical protein
MDYDISSLFELNEHNQFVPLKFCPAIYEIEVNYPHRIRSHGNANYFYPKVNLSHKSGCLQVNLGGWIGTQRLHYLIAYQLVHNFDKEKNTEVDHISGVNTDNRISNLRWYTKSENQRNRLTSQGELYERFDTLPNGSQELTYYKKHKLEQGYWKYIDETTNEVSVFYKNEPRC